MSRLKLTVFRRLFSFVQLVYVAAVIEFFDKPQTTKSSGFG